VKHVKLKQDFADFPKGTIFAIVPHRCYWGTVINEPLHTSVSDGKWIGGFEAGMERSPITPYCIELSGYNFYKHLFGDSDEA